MIVKKWHSCLLTLKDPFAILREDNLSSNPILKDNAASAYQLFLVIGIIGLVLTLIINGLYLIFSKDSSKKSEIKLNIGTKTLVAIIFFGFITFIGIVYRIIMYLT